MKRIIIIMAALCGFCAARGLTPAEQLFVDAPAWAFPTLNRTTRLDMLDYYHSGSAHPSRNELSGRSRVLEADSTQIEVKTSDLQRVQLTILPAKHDTLIMMITTVMLPGGAKPRGADGGPDSLAVNVANGQMLAFDSQVAFYTYDWQKEKPRLLKMPTLADWTLPGVASKTNKTAPLEPDNAPVTRQDLENALPFVTATVSYYPPTATLTLVNTLADYLPSESARVVAALRPSLAFRWTGTTFRPLK